MKTLSTSYLLKKYARPAKCILCLFYLLQTEYASAQILVRGKLTDASTLHPLVSATVKEKGTSHQVITDSQGTYQISTSSGKVVLVFSYLGYIPMEVPVDNRQQINTSLQPDDASLEEVVVVGYGTVKKSDLTGSVSSLKQDDFNKGAVTSVEQLMQGKAAGVQIVQNTGEPGGGMSINVRGIGSITGGTSPLYVIDGLPIDNSVLISGTGNQVAPNRSPRNPLASLNPADIESIEILKDASATAIYGARGANGVVIVTTKSGKSGDLQVNYSGNIGIQNVHKRLDLLNPQQYMEGINSLIDAGEGTESQRVTEIQNGGTDWQDVIYQKNAQIQTHDVSLSWGNPNTSYLLALNNMNQDGLIKNSGYARYGSRFNLRHQTERFKMGFSGNMSYINDNLAPFGFDIGERGGVTNAAKVSDPTIPVKNAEGNYVRSSFMTLDNAEAILTGSHLGGNRYRYFGTFYSEYAFLPYLSAKINIGGDVDNENRTAYLDRTTLQGANLNGIGTAYEGTQTNYLVEGTLNFNRHFGDHSLQAVAGATTQKFLRRTSTIQGNNFTTDATQAFNFSLADPTTLNVSSSKSANQLLSYLGRVNYSFQDRYLFTASYRIDGSSRFGEQNRFGYFPSFSAGWNMDHETFFGNLKQTINNLKLRASWGKTGNQDIGNNQYLVTFASGSRTSYVLNNQFTTSLNPTRIANPDLKWETTEQYDIGLDVGLWQDRITGTLDWYKKNTYDMLIDLPVPTSSGYDSRLVNIGRMENSGFELMLSSRNIDRSNFSWRTDINFSTLKNKVKSLGSISRILDGSMSQFNQFGITTPGLPIESFYGYQVTGIWQTNEQEEAKQYGALPGDFKFKDVNNDGAITTDDRMDLGNSIPDFSWGLTNTIRYKPFELYIFFQGVEGVKMLNGDLLETYLPRGGNLRSNRLAEPFLHRWTPENPTQDEPSFLGTRQFSQGVNSKTVKNASYVKLQTVRLSYTLPARLTGKVLKSAQFFITGQNLLTFSHYNGFDPALNPNGGTYFRIDWNGYPSARTYLIGANLSF